MIWSTILKTTTGKNITQTHSPLFFDAVETRSKILGSLASRWAKGPIKPTSEFGRQPVISRKRARRKEPEPPSRKSTRRRVAKSRFVQDGCNSSSYRQDIHNQIASAVASQPQLQSP
jgi:hypothetical protein